uniref:Uncharacterized protein n=1 Tax=Schistosoma curassoni TaxID=6186 RepID=A0A183L7V3_9TREM
MRQVQTLIVLMVQIISLVSSAYSCIFYTEMIFRIDSYGRVDIMMIDYRLMCT